MIADSISEETVSSTNLLMARNLIKLLYQCSLTICCIFNNCVYIFVKKISKQSDLILWINHQRPTTTSGHQNGVLNGHLQET